MLPPLPPDPSLPLPLENLFVAQVVNVALADHEKVFIIPGPEHARRASLTWSPDSSRLAWINASPYTPDSRDLLLYALTEGRLTKVRRDRERPYVNSQVKWLRPHHLLAYISSKPGQAGRWNEISQDGAPQEIPHASEIPHAIATPADSCSFLYLMN